MTHLTPTIRATWSVAFGAAVIAITAFGTIDARAEEASMEPVTLTVYSDYV